MKIDSHQHFWIYNKLEYDWIDESMSTIRRDFLPVHLAEELKKNQFDGSVAVQARQSIEETEWLLRLAETNQIIKGVVGWVDLQSPNIYDQLKKYAAHPKFVGVRHVVQGEPDDDFILRPGFNEGISLLKEFNLTFDILIFPKHLPYAITFAEQHPDITFILDHIAKPSIKTGEISIWKENIRKLAKFPNMYCKVSGMVTEASWVNWKPDDFKPYLDTIFSAFGSERIMIGSDWPVCLVAGNYPEIISIVSDYISNLSDSQKNNILGNNAIKIYNLRVP
jgi:L-fuconolactonase